MRDVAADEKSELRIHIGAHKTASTHIQDTLREVSDELSSNGVLYVHRLTARPRFSRLKNLVNTSDDYLSLSDIQREKRIQSILTRNLIDYQSLLFSEENICGNNVELLSTKPYKNLHRNISYIHYLCSSYRVHIYFAIRSFSRVYPGAYSTALRFRPEEAIRAKNETINSLGAGSLPTWIPLLEIIIRTLPNACVRIWTQEDYQNDPQYFIRKLIGKDDQEIPNLPPPRSTITPSKIGVEKAESIYLSGTCDPTNWRFACEKIYAQNPSSSESQRFTFLDKSLEENLSYQYDKDLEEISLRWSELRIRLGE